MGKSAEIPEGIGLVEPQVFDCREPLELACGARLPGFRMVYETYGQLNSRRDNALLICHALSGNHHAAGYHNAQDKRPGWWDNLVGPGKPIDTDTWFVVCPNNIGGCHGSTGPASDNPETGKPYGPDFPPVVVGDWVSSQHRLMGHLGLERWGAVAGGSLGGMQALQWAIDFPDCIDNALIIAASARLTAQNIAFNVIARHAILADPHFHDGHYQERGVTPKSGLAVARMLGHVSYLSSDSMDERFGRQRQDDERLSFGSEFSIEGYLRHQGESFAGGRFDANTYMLMTRALDNFDPASAYGGSLARAFEGCRARHLVISFTADWRFSPEHSRGIVNALVRAKQRVSYFEVESSLGHDDFLLENEGYFKVMRAFLS